MSKPEPIPMPPYDFGGAQGRYPRCSKDGSLCGAGGYCSACPSQPKPGLSRGLLVIMAVYVAVLIGALLLAHWVAR